MNNDKSGNEDHQHQKLGFDKPPASQTPPHTRVVEIPVQHFNSPVIDPASTSSSSSSSLPNSANFFRDNLREHSPIHIHKKRQDPFNQKAFFNTPSLFDRFEDPSFDILDSPLSRHFNNQSRSTVETDPRFPLLSRFGLSDVDDFFRPQVQQDRPDLGFKHSNSPVRELINQINNNSTNTNTNTNTNSNSNSPRSQSQPRITPPRTQAQVVDQPPKKEASPIPVSHNKQDSPKRFTTQTTVYPNQPAQNTSGTNTPPRIPIRIEHLSKSDFKYTDSESGKPSSPSSSAQNSDSKMGSTMSNQNAPNKPKPAGNFANVSDFTGQPKPAPQAPEAPPKQTNKPKTAQEKCEDISKELETYSKQVEQFNGKKGDKSFLLLEEILTRVLLRLDEIERGDDMLNQTRKSLINFTHQLSDKLEEKASLNSAISLSNKCNNVNSNSNNNNNNNEGDSTEANDDEAKSEGNKLEGNTDSNLDTNSESVASDSQKKA